VKVVRSASQPNYNFKTDPTLKNYSQREPDRDLVETTEYDALGRVIRTRRLLDNRPIEQWETTLFGYDGLGRQMKVVRSASQPDYNLAADPSLSNYRVRENPDQDIVTFTAYDDTGRVMYTQDAGDIQTWFAYDGLGRQIKTIVNPLGTANDGGVKDPRSPYYNRVDNLPDRDIMALTTYDADGRVLWTQDVLGRKTWSAYDQRGRLVKTVANATGTAVDFSPRDPRSPVYLRSSNSDQDVITQTVYDAQGRVEQSVDSRGNPMRYRYDTLGRRIQTIVNFVDRVRNPSFPDEDRIETTTYDLAGRAVETADAAGIKMRNEYDRLGRRVKTIVNYVDGVFSSAVPDEDLISATAYNKAGQVIAATDARGTQTAFTYDKAGRRLTVTQAANSPLASASYTCYDKVGRVLRTIQNWTNDPTQPSPDARDIKGNWLFVPIHNASNDRDLVTLFDYDRASRRTKVTDPVGNFSMTAYFKDGQVKSITDRRHGHAVPLRRCVAAPCVAGFVSWRRPRPLGVEQRLEAQRRDPRSITARTMTRT
jgi:YD repeat-containing protein